MLYFKIQKHFRSLLSSLSHLTLTSVSCISHSHAPQRHPAHHGVAVVPIHCRQVDLHTQVCVRHPDLPPCAALLRGLTQAFNHAAAAVNVVIVHPRAGVNAGIHEVNSAGGNAGGHDSRGVSSGSGGFGGFGDEFQPVRERPPVAAEPVDSLGVGVDTVQDALLEAQGEPQGLLADVLGAGGELLDVRRGESLRGALLGSLAAAPGVGGGR
mmetsp:Transcript_23436/g.57435  ORF Transcript_23436/g.57435 Transcript_23436/m.57435 type:complete len:211 (-) Transcript_23436:349-981(-)